MKFLDWLLPTPADNRARGSTLPAGVFALISIVSVVRSCIHLLAPDGGAGSIAGMDLSVAGASDIIFAFALWGGSQLIYAFVQLLVAFRYRSLIPFMYCLLILEALSRLLVGRMRPVTFSHTPPGATANYVMLMLASAMLVFSYLSAQRQAAK